MFGILIVTNKVSQTNVPCYKIERNELFCGKFLLSYPIIGSIYITEDIAIIKPNNDNILMESVAKNGLDIIKNIKKLILEIPIKNFNITSFEGINPINMQ